ncbi:hypothetical protein BDB00DRAFT_167847 [Zychaea mexicana]|uniref:uncharacterized protein n=1 Tax=Zychaea mexicana TaxID=64656 RepID=UPI0022FF3F8D|nr:uncharacterized protein BDB00DRAFT_167847 [Zychaea mexicana]KAI9482552.1 hypothetical protein BDB00DRAFT_167847 [Zychaea mexicana]
MVNSALLRSTKFLVISLLLSNDISATAVRERRKRKRKRVSSLLSGLGNYHLLQAHVPVLRETVIINEKLFKYR